MTPCALTTPSTSTRALPNGQLCVMPGVSHRLPIKKPEEIVRIILGFLRSNAQPEALFPILRK